MAKMLVPPQFSYYADDAGYTVYDGETPLGPEAVCRMLEKSEADLAHIEALDKKVAAAQKYVETLLEFGDDETGHYHVGDEVALEDLRAALAKGEGKKSLLDIGKCCLWGPLCLDTCRGCRP